VLLRLLKAASSDTTECPCPLLISGCAICFSSVGGIACKIGYSTKLFYTSTPTNRWLNTENANGALEDTLRHFVDPYQNTLEALLTVAEFTLNNAWNTTMQNTPFMLIFQQNHDTPVISSLRSSNPSVDQFVGRRSEHLSKARESIQVAQQRQKQHADRHRCAAPT
jgi:hypothetical protein